MAKYTSSDVHVDALLSNISIGYSNPSYIADQIFPIVPVMKRSDQYLEFDQSHWFRDGAQLRGPGTKSRRGGWTYSKTPYYCHRYSFGTEIYDEDRDNADEQFQLDSDATDFATDKLFLRREIDFAGSFFKTGVWGADKTGGTDFTAWSNYATSSPLTDMSGWCDDIEGKIGREPNRLVIGKQVWTQLKWHPDLIDTIKHTQTAQMTLNLAATLLEVDNILVGRAIQTTDPEGTAESSVTYSRIWGKNALLTYTPSSPALRTPAAGYTFAWRRVSGMIQYMRRMRDDERETDIIEANSYYDQKVTAANAGLFASGAVA